MTNLSHCQPHQSQNKNGQFLFSPSMCKSVSVNSVYPGVGNCFTSWTYRWYGWRHQRWLTKQVYLCCQQFLSHPPWQNMQPAEGKLAPALSSASFSGNVWLLSDGLSCSSIENTGPVTHRLWSSFRDEHALQSTSPCPHISCFFLLPFCCLL